MTNTAPTPTLEQIFAQTFIQRGAWYEHIESGEKVRGRAAAEALLDHDLEEADTLSAAEERMLEAATDRVPEVIESTSLPATDGRVRSYEEAIARPVGSRFFAAEGVEIPASGRFFKTTQPITVIECVRCGTRRAMHVQDAPLARGRCFECTKADRRAARRARRQAKSA